MQILRRLFLGVAGAAMLLVVAGIVRNDAALWQPAAVAAAVAFAIGLGAVPSLKTYQFTAWIVAGWRLFPRMTTMSSVRLTTPPLRRTSARPHGHGSGSIVTRSPVR